MPNTEPENKILYEAVACEDILTVQELIADRINVYQLAYGEWDESWKDFITPLEKAVQLGNKEILQVLLTAGAKFPYWQEEYLGRALKIASYFGNLELVQHLLQTGSKNQKQMATRTLAFALKKEHSNIARALIEVGADLNWKSEWGRPVEVAASSGNINLVKLLVEAGADVNAVRDEPPYIGSLGIAANCGHQEVFDYLFPLVSDPEEREYAQKEITQGIIRKQRRENKLLNEFFKALGEGSTQGEVDVEAVRRLISAGVDINAFCETGKTAIHLAVYWGSIRRIELLAELGADLDILDESGGSTPLMMAVAVREAWAVRALIRSGANVNARNRYGYFEMPFTIEDILAEFDCTLVRQQLDLPQSNSSFNLELLERELNRNRNRIELVNETARREALISPILFEVAELTNQRINVEYSIAVNEHFRGTVDYYIASGNLVIIEAKQADLVRGFTQLAVELVALDRWTRSDTPILYGMVTTGEDWRFGTFA
ncbi:MAG: hypothetical protein Fur006_59340 [Coleofasciculaceae cyanobacterium]